MSTAAMHIPTTGLSHKDWLRMRQRGIGSSDVGAILGLNPYRTAYDVYLEKIADEPIETPLNAAMEFGLKLEGIIADTYAERNGRVVRRDDVIRIHPEHAFMMANLDRIIEPADGEGEGILEVKTASGRAVKHWESEIPLGYFAQIQHQFFVTGFTWGAFALLVDGREYSDISVKPDPDYIKTQNERLFQFWNENVLPRVPPPPTVADLEKLKPKTGTEIEASDEIAELCREIAAIRASISAKKKLQEELEEKLKEFIGENERLIHKGIEIASWKQQFRKGYTTKDTTFRVLKLKMTEE